MADSRAETTRAERLREQAAKARRLAKTIPTDPAAKSLDELAEQLDAQAKSLDSARVEPPPVPKP